MTYVRNKQSGKKLKRCTTDLDEWDYRAAKEVIALQGIDMAKFLRLGARLYVEVYHEQHSIGRRPPQQDFCPARLRV